MTTPVYRIVLDTNILVSALHNRNSPPGRILASVGRFEHQACVSKDVVAEYVEVLTRPKFDYIAREDIDETLGFLDQHGLWVIPRQTVSVIATDPSDNQFLECAMAGRADFLVTGNLRHFDMPSFEGIRIVSARDFCGIGGI